MFHVLLSLSTILAISLTSPENIFAATHTEQVKSVNIRASKGILENAITRTAIEDVVNLLRKGFPRRLCFS